MESDSLASRLLWYHADVDAARQITARIIALNDSNHTLIVLGGKPVMRSNSVTMLLMNILWKQQEKGGQISAGLTTAVDSPPVYLKSFTNKRLNQNAAAEVNVNACFT